MRFCKDCKHFDSRNCGNVNHEVIAVFIRAINQGDLNVRLNLPRN